MHHNQSIFLHGTSVRFQINIQAILVLAQNHVIGVINKQGGNYRNNNGIKGKSTKKLQILVFAATCECVFQLQWIADTTASILGRACQTGAPQEPFYTLWKVQLGHTNTTTHVKDTATVEHNVNRGFGSGKPNDLPDATLWPLYYAFKYHREKCKSRPLVSSLKAVGGQSNFMVFDQASLLI